MMESSAFYEHLCSHITLVDPARHFYAVLAFQYLAGAFQRSTFMQHQGASAALVDYTSGGFGQDG